MVEIGRFNQLEVVKTVDFGVYLDGGELGNILLPNRYVPEGTQLGDTLEVFIYFDSEDDVIATTEKPLAQVGEFSLMKIVATGRIGAFADWGLKKDLLIPFSEQRGPMQEGRSYLVRVYTDRASGRLVGSTKLNKFLGHYPPHYEQGEEVSLIIAEQTDLGFKAIVNNVHWGLIFKSESFGKLHIGKRLRGYIKQIREDGKIDISLQKPGRAKDDDLAERILRMLRKQDGTLPVGDKSPPEAIYQLFHTSKGTFKRAIGALYKRGLIELSAKEIRLK